jgi:hypothetical protein
MARRPEAAEIKPILRFTIRPIMRCSTHRHRAVYRPRRELQKAAPRDFDAFFEPVYFEKQKKTVEIPAVRARRFNLVFCSAPFAIPGFGRAMTSFACRNQAAETKGSTRHDHQEDTTHRGVK